MAVGAQTVEHLQLCKFGLGAVNGVGSMSSVAPAHRPSPTCATPVARAQKPATKIPAGVRFHQGTTGAISAVGKPPQGRDSGKRNVLRARMLHTVRGDAPVPALLSRVHVYPIFCSPRDICTLNWISDKTLASVFFGNKLAYILLRWHAFMVLSITTYHI